MASQTNTPSLILRKHALTHMPLTKRSPLADKGGEVSLSQIRSTLFSPLAVPEIEPPTVAPGRFARWFGRVRRSSI